jgi:rRNA maturation RNase YbeY
MTSFSKVCFFFEHRNFSLENRTLLKKFIESIFRREKRKIDSLNYVFVSDKRLLEINHQFLGHDYYTDIITFDISEGSSIKGEVYISIDRLKENSKKLGVSFKSELHRVIFHGALHLCGFKDNTTTERKKMRAREDFYLFGYFK